LWVLNLKCGVLEEWRKQSDCVKNEVALHRVKKERNILHTIKQRKATWIGHILCRNCILKHVIEGKIEKEREGRRRRGRNVSSYWMTLQKREDRESTRSHWLENLLSNRLWNSLRTGYTMKELGNSVKIFMFQDIISNILNRTFTCMFEHNSSIQRRL
jgi:hypothetical protein